MSHPSTPRRRMRRAALAAAGVSLIATISPLVSANPAAAATAPLTTTDGIGIRIDENAILGPALELIEDELQPYVNQKIYEGALANSVMDDPDWVQGSANVELSFDFVNAGVSGYPQGGLKVHADLNDILMRFYRYGEWWQPECQFRVNPDPGYIDASAKINSALLPAAPLQLNPITAYWDNDPAITREKGNWLCSGYLIDEWWDGLWGSGTDVADQLETELNAQAQDLVNDLWADHVTPIVNSLNEFGITFNQIRTDDHGLIVTANTNASSGISIPGMGTFNVSAAEDAGVTSNVNTLLATRASDAIVSVHPNVVNQFLTALNGFTGGGWASNVLPASIETTLFGGPNAAFADSGWGYELSISGEGFVKPTGPGGAPRLQAPTATLTIGHNDFGVVAVYEGSISNIELRTIVRDAGRWGPDFNGANLTTSMTRTYAEPGVIATPAQMVPTVKAGIAQWNTNIFESFLTLAPVSIGGLPVAVCTSCGRYTGDQRYTETFTIA